MPACCKGCISQSQICCGKLRHGAFVLQDNAPVHNSQIAIAAVKEYGFQVLSHYEVPFYYF